MPSCFTWKERLSHLFVFICLFVDFHLSPWIGNAVGALNHKFFVLFIFYTVLSCLFSLLLMLVRAVHCAYMVDDDSSHDEAAAGVTSTTTNDYNNSDRHYLRERQRFLSSHYSREECHGWHDHTVVLVLFVISLVFLIFTCCMLVEQLEAIETNASKIARMKMRVGQAGTELSRVTEEFNEMFGGQDKKVVWHWFLPLPVDFPRGMRKVVLGYEWDETFDAVPYDEDARATAAAAADAVATVGVDEEQGKIELTPRTASDATSPAIAAAVVVSTLKSPPPNSGLDPPSAVAAAAAAACTSDTNGLQARPFSKKSPSSAETLTKRSNSRASSQERFDVNKGTLT
jgi:multidrug efflux pump subunit AcrB